MMRLWVMAWCQAVGEHMMKALRLTTEWVVDRLLDARCWWLNHAVDLLFLVSILLLVVLAIVLWRRYDQDWRQQIDLCMRAFEYTRDQCEFIIRNRIVPQ